MDAGVMVRAMRSRWGAAAEVLRLALIMEVQMVLDARLAGVYRAAVDEAFGPGDRLVASGKSREQMEGLLRVLEDVAEAVEVVPSLESLLRDAGADATLEVAVCGAVKVLVAEDVKRFRGAGRFGVKLMTPVKLLQKLRDGR